MDGCRMKLSLTPQRVPRDGADRRHAAARDQRGDRRSSPRDPLPTGSTEVEGQGGCHFLTIDRYCILHHIDQRDEALTVLGVVEGPVPRH